MAALDGALALERVHDVAVGVAEHLDLDVPTPLEVALEEHRRIAECGCCLVARSRHRLEQVLGLADQAHALAAAARGGLDQQGQAHLSAGRGDVRVAGVRRELGSGDERHPGRRHQPLGLDLERHGVHRLGRRPDPGQAGISHGPGERRVLRQEAVTRVDRIGPGPARGVQHLLGHQVGLRRCPPPDRHGEVGVPDERRARIRVGVDRDGLQAHPVCGADHPARDLPPVRDEDQPDGPAPHRVGPR